MRTLRKNQQVMYYSNYVGSVTEYERDADGNIIYTDVDGESVPVESVTLSSYSEPIEFKANISVNSGETRLAEYGLNEGDYNAVICADKGKFPFDERTLIWRETEPQFEGNVVKPESADYKVIAVKTSLNEERFILKARDKDG